MSDKKEVQEDCFADLVCLSPRLQWLATHSLETVLQQLPRLGIGPRSTLPWCCHNLTKTVAVFGEDELEATKLMASILGIKHWETEAYEQARGKADVEAGDDWGDGP